MNKKMVSHLFVGVLGIITGAFAWSWLCSDSGSQGSKKSKDISAKPSQTIPRQEGENERLKRELFWAKSELSYHIEEAKGLRFQVNTLEYGRDDDKKEIEQLKAQLVAERKESYQKDQRIVELQLQSVKLSRELLEEVKKSK